MPTEDIIFYVYDKDYVPSVEEADPKKNGNGQITKKNIPMYTGEDGYENAMNRRDEYLKELKNKNKKRRE